MVVIVVVVVNVIFVTDVAVIVVVAFVVAFVVVASVIVNCSVRPILPTTHPSISIAGINLDELFPNGFVRQIIDYTSTLLAVPCVSLCDCFHAVDQCNGF